MLGFLFGNEKRMSFFIIISGIPLLNSRTRRQIFLRKESENYLPSNMNIYTSVSSINMAIAAVSMFECVLMSSGL